MDRTKNDGQPDERNVNACRHPDPSRDPHWCGSNRHQQMTYRNQWRGSECRKKNDSGGSPFIVCASDDREKHRDSDHAGKRRCNTSHDRDESGQDANEGPRINGPNWWLPTWDCWWKFRHWTLHLGELLDEKQFFQYVNGIMENRFVEYQRPLLNTTRIRLIFLLKVPKGNSKDNSDKVPGSMGRIIWNERSYQHRTVQVVGSFAQSAGGMASSGLRE